MKISELIKHLSDLQQSQGDLEVFEGDSNTTCGCIRPAKPPKVTNVAILSGRERNARHVFAGEDSPDKWGRKILYIGR